VPNIIDHPRVRRTKEMWPELRSKILQDPLSLAVGKKSESIDLDLISMDSTHFSSETPSVDYSSGYCTALFLGWAFEKKKAQCTFNVPPVYVNASYSILTSFDTGVPSLVRHSRWCPIARSRCVPAESTV
jgi:hypothetical protein